MTATVSDEIAGAAGAFRRFNRFYTRIIGLLDEGLLESGYSLTEARVLFELATRGDAGASEIAAALGVDAGYLSRILRGFEKTGLLTRSPLATDARHAVLRLTRKGRAAFAELDRRSAGQAHGVLDALTPAKRQGLIRAMQSIEDLLGGSGESKPLFVLRPHRPGDMGWVVARQSVLYTREYGWDGQYEALASRIVADFIEHFDPAKERCWIAERDGEPLGAIFLVKHPEREGVAKLRLLHVEHVARGMGLGRALVRECVEFARSAGYKTVTLWTQSILHAAHKLYQEAGFRLIAEEAHHSFGKDLVGQTWEMNLEPR
jgi:DNA-binding MarR family transcriptional regulator/GNAT superfamily N-acetyltransferase